MYCLAIRGSSVCISSARRGCHDLVRGSTNKTHHVYLPTLNSDMEYSYCSPAKARLIGDVLAAQEAFASRTVLSIGRMSATFGIG